MIMHTNIYPIRYIQTTNFIQRFLHFCNFSWLQMEGVSALLPMLLHLNCTLKNAYFICFNSHIYVINNCQNDYIIPISSCVSSLVFNYWEYGLNYLFHDTTSQLYQLRGLQPLHFDLYVIQIQKSMFFECLWRSGDGGQTSTTLNWSRNNAHNVGDHPLLNLFEYSNVLLHYRNRIDHINAVS